MLDFNKFNKQGNAFKLPYQEKNKSLPPDVTRTAQGLTVPSEIPVPEIPPDYEYLNVKPTNSIPNTNRDGCPDPDPFV